MWKWTKRVLTAIIIIASGYVAYDAYRAGYHTRPDMPEGAFSLSYKNGMRAILVGIPNQKDTRRYFGFPMEVPFYLEDAWSFCYPPNDEEEAHAISFIKDRDWPGERFEAVCKITVENEIVVRGLITSVPKL